jgi:hypothetical protein
VQISAFQDLVDIGGRAFDSTTKRYFTRRHKPSLSLGREISVDQKLRCSGVERILDHRNGRDRGQCRATWQPIHGRLSSSHGIQLGHLHETRERVFPSGHKIYVVHVAFDQSWFLLAELFKISDALFFAAKRDHTG